MKKYLVLILFSLSFFYSQGQNLDDIKKLVILTQYTKAKPEIDSYLANAANAAKPEGWYYKAFVYNSLGRVATNPVAEAKSLYTGAFDALKKYASLDAKAPLTVEEKNSTVYNVYSGLYDLGIKTYNDKDFAESFDCFKKTLEVHDYVYENKLYGPGDLKFSAHDTDIVWNLTILANELKKKDDALVYYKRIADADLFDEKYETAYDDLIKKYKREKNAELFAKYLSAAKKHYPVDSEYWEGMEIDFALDGLEDEALLNKYEELTKTLPESYMVHYNYALDIDKFLTSSASEGKEKAGYRARMLELFLKSRTIRSTIEANLQLANIYYSRTYDIQERIGRITGTKPAELQVKKQLTDSLKTTMKECIPFATEAVRMLAELKEYKYSEKANYKLALEILSKAYKMEGNAVKAAEYDKKKEEVDKL